MVSTVGHEEQEAEGAMADSVKEEAMYMSLETLSWKDSFFSTVRLLSSALFSISIFWGSFS
jgi:hypothetical protein